MDQFPKLTTERLIVDQIKLSDIPNIVAYAGNIKIVENTRSMPHPYYEEDAIAWINMANSGFKAKDNYMFAIRFCDTLSFIGGIGLTIDLENNRAELGYWLAEDYWNMGLTTEAVKAILKFGFENLNLNKIFAVYLTSNVASGRVMIKNGMVKEAEFKDHDIKRGHTVEDNMYVSLIQYRMTKSEYKSL
ncbi:MAG: GNAT family N-acetyltransferase [Maribacter sp.]|uniref:GNAT family N-acetyltransferase n=1 Tax=Maribacter sp. TaxID=1897614 RepID=UPI003C7222AF